ncbi:MAG: hypothetical protein CVU90_05120 [Firmicutes bacterium HGW-Firmicutes-15]|nr:MAG: hypothetical protein CVU90_05120 [Firmicutes bacterium HGW-Firmicutes-15]
MLGYTVGGTLVLSCLLAIISLIRIFNGKRAGGWGKATGAFLILFTCAFVLWVTIEIPTYERQQAKINYQKGQEYLRTNDYDQAVNSFAKISKLDKQTYAEVQPLLQDLKLKLAQTQLEQAQLLFVKQQYPEALLGLNRSLQYTELEDAKALLPIYQAAAGKK